MSDAFMPSTVRFANRVISWMKKRPRLYKAVYKFARWHDDAMDYRKFGLMRDDLIPEEHAVVHEALECLSEREVFDRSFRLRRAIQLNMTHEVLEPAEQIPFEKDVPYLWKHIDRICEERGEKVEFDQFNPKTSPIYQKLFPNTNKDPQVQDK